MYYNYRFPPLLISCLLLLLWSCDKEVEELSEDTLSESLQSSESFTKASPQVYRAAGDAYREDMFYFMQDLNAGTLEISDQTDDIYLGSKEKILGGLESYVSQGVVAEHDLAKLLEYENTVARLRTFW